MNKREEEKLKRQQEKLKKELERTICRSGGGRCGYLAKG